MDIASLVIGGSMLIMGPIEIPETAPPRAFAQVIFENHGTNVPSDERSYVLQHPDVVVQVEFGFNVGAGGSDSVTLIPPVGWTCDPVDCTLELQEGYQGIMFLFPWEGM